MKTRTIRKVIISILAVFLISSPVYAQKIKLSAATKKKFANMPVLRDSKGKKWNLKGMDIIVADWWSPTEVPAPTNAVEEAIAEYRDWIQVTYNFRIKQVGVTSWGSSPEFFTNFATNGGPENYVYIMRQNAIAAPMKNGLFYDLSTLSSFNFKEPKWVKAITNLTTVNGKIYGMRAVEPEPKFGLYFNKRMLQEAGVDPESLYDMQAAGTWTWDAFEKICAKVTRDTNNDGVIDVYALTNFSKNFFNMVVASNGATFIDRDKSGKFFNATKTNNFLEAMNWGDNMIRKYEMPTPEGSAWDYSFAAFRNGEAAMQVAAEYDASQIRTMKDDYGFVCFPKGPRMTDYVNIWDDNVYVIPACYDANRAEMIAFAYNLYTEPTPGWDDEDDWKIHYLNRFRDPRAVDETIDRLRKNGVVWYNTLIPSIDTGDIIYQVYGGWATTAEKVEEVATKWQPFIDEANGIR